MVFQDRFEAGPFLASRLADLRDSADIVVLTLLLGAVPVACEVARAVVVHLPRSKRRTQYFTPRLAAQLDAAIHVDQTPVLQPLEIASRRERGRRAAGNLSVAV